MKNEDVMMLKDIFDSSLQSFKENAFDPFRADVNAHIENITTTIARQSERITVVETELQGMDNYSENRSTIKKNEDRSETNAKHIWALLIAILVGVLGLVIL